MATEGFRKVRLADVRHARIFYDDRMYAAHPNRGGIWNFGNGEIAVAHMVKPADYKTGEGVHHLYWNSTGAGVMLNRSYDGGQTWPEDEKGWDLEQQQARGGDPLLAVRPGRSSTSRSTCPTRTQ